MTEPKRPLKRVTVFVYADDWQALQDIASRRNLARYEGRTDWSASELLREVMTEVQR